MSLPVSGSYRGYVLSNQAIYGLLQLPLHKIFPVAAGVQKLEVRLNRKDVDCLLIHVTIYFREHDF